MERRHGSVENPGADRSQVVGDPDQDGRRSGGEGDHAQGWRRYGQDNARAVSRADRARNRAVETAHPGDRAAEIIAAALGMLKTRLRMSGNTRSPPPRSHGNESFDLRNGCYRHETSKLQGEWPRQLRRSN